MLRLNHSDAERVCLTGASVAVHWLRCHLASEPDRKLAGTCSKWLHELANQLQSS